MAHLKHPEHGTEIECDDQAANSLVGDGWEVVGGDDAKPDDKPAGRRRAPRKGADD